MNLMTFSSLYTWRPLLNAGEVATWFAQHGFRSVMAPANMHVTICYSKQTLWWERAGAAPVHIVVSGGRRTVEQLGKEGAVVMRFESSDLQNRHRQFRDAGASHDFPSYLPHVTISYIKPRIDFERHPIPPFPGDLVFGPEVMETIVSGGWTPDPSKEVATVDLLDKAVVARIPAVIKARPQEASGRRIVEVEASCEDVDYDGDVVLQKGLLDSGDSFVASGHLDIDHYSEFGARLGIPDPSSYIVGRPLDVRKAANGRTFVEGEIRKALGGQFDPVRNRFDEFWASLQSDPPVQWYSSIYGFPTDYDDCTTGFCDRSTGATRLVIKAIDWRSLAFTRTPKNTGLKSPTRIVTAKAFLAELVKAMPPQAGLPTTMQDVWNAGACQKCMVHTAPSLLGYRQHFAKCCGWPSGVADLCAHAVMHKHGMRRAFGDTEPGFTPSPSAGSPAAMTGG
jgi:hypothetical protein